MIIILLFSLIYLVFFILIFIWTPFITYSRVLILFFISWKQWESRYTHLQNLNPLRYHVERKVPNYEDHKKCEKIHLLSSDRGRHLWLSKRWVKLPCVCVCLLSGDLFNFSVRISSFFPIFCALRYWLWKQNKIRQ